jgi:hypothetical protein
MADTEHEGERRSRLRQYQVQLLERMQAAQAAGTTAARELGVLIGTRHYLLDLTQVGEIVPFQSATAVPLTQPWYLGLANVRGSLVGVIDLAAYLAHHPAPSPGRHRAREPAADVCRRHQAAVRAAGAPGAGAAPAGRHAVRRRRHGSAGLVRRAARRHGWPAVDQAGPGPAGVRTTFPARGSLVGKETMRFRFSRQGRQEPPPDSRFADGGDSQFAHAAQGPSDADAPLRLRDVLRSRAGAGAVREPVPALRLPLIGHLSPQRQLSYLVTALAVVLALSAGLVALNAQHSAASAAATQLAGDALMHSQRIGKAAPNALQGNDEAFRQLDESQRELDSDLALLDSGGSYRGRSVAAAAGTLQQAVADARARWAASAKAADTLLGHRGDLAGVEKSLRALEALAPQLLAQAEAIAALRLQRGAGAREIAALGRLTMLTQRMSLGTAGFTAAGGIRSETAFQLGRDITTFRATVDALLNGGRDGDVAGIAAVNEADVRARLTALRTDFEQYQAQAGAILGRLERLLAARNAERLIFSQNETLRQSLARLLDGYRAAQESLNWTFWLMVGGGMLVLLNGRHCPRAAA